MCLQYLQKQGLITNSAFCFNSVLLKVITGSRWQTFFSVKDLKQLWKWVISFNLPLYKPLTNETFFWCEFSHNWCIMLGFYSNVYFLVQKYLTRVETLLMHFFSCELRSAAVVLQLFCSVLYVSPWGCSLAWLAVVQQFGLCTYHHSVVGLNLR